MPELWRLLLGRPLSGLVDSDRPAPPLTAFVDVLRSIMNEGASMLGVVQPTLILLAWGVPS